MSGKVFPHFTVDKAVYKDYNGIKKLYWQCKCECGNTFFSTKSTIYSGKVKSCGCYQKNLQRKRLLSSGSIHVGDIFGILKVVEKTQGADGKSIYECECECGNKVSLSGTHLKKRYSCGCMTSGYIDDTNVPKESFVHLGKKTQRNTSGCVGVSYHSDKRKWRAAICFAGKQHHLGYYDNKDDAIRARKIAEHNIYNDFTDFIEKSKNANNAFKDLGQEY